VDLVTASSWPAPSGSPGGAQTVDLDGHSDGAISQTARTSRHKRYGLSFQLAGNPNGAEVGGASVRPVKHLVIMINGHVLHRYSFNTAQTSASDMGFRRESISFTAKGNRTVVTFASGDPVSSQSGPVVARIALTAN
jgi:hypothetical protein